MKIVGVMGSPRSKSNSTLLAKKIIYTAKELGAESENFYLNELIYKGCQACRGCKDSKDYCILKDDLEEVIEKVREADALVMASPVYFGDVSGQMKKFIDRTYCFFDQDFVTRLAPGKKLIFVLVQGNPSEEVFADIYPRYETFFKMYGFDTKCLRAVGLMDPGAVAEDKELLKRAEEMGRELMQ